MVQGHTNGLTFVLEDEHVIDLFAGSKLSVAVGPDLDEVSGAAFAQGRERRVVVVRVEDDLADAKTWGRWRQVGTLLVGFRSVRCERGEPVLEDDNVVVVPWHFGREPAWLRRTQRAVLRRWQERTVLTMGSVGHPFAECRVPAELVQSSSSSK